MNRSMLKNPKVSVIIPTYNRAHCVGEAIESVLSQTFRDFELIVVDDGSTDNTQEVLSKYGSAIRVIRQENSGVSAARNTGIKASRGEWVAFLDSDDLWEPEKLMVQMEDVTSNPEVVAHMVDAVITDLPGKEISLFNLRGIREEFEKRPLRIRPLADVIKTQFFTPCWLINRKALEKTGLFNMDLIIYEDMNLLARVALEGPFYVNTYIGVKVRRRSSEAISDLHKNKRIDSLYYIGKTYMDLVKDKRLTFCERKMIRRYLGGNYCEIMAEHMKKRQWKHAALFFIRSIYEDLGFRSFLRALFWICDVIFNFRLSRLRRKSYFRRSEFNKDQSLKMPLK